ncbi:hypothetical protein K491DRAFT_711373 [Lophiostoma macrostomum CBS 122681]|uniref:P-loop containing nucleoside triphosphate hydrolase protein n=1 Tax=Lophiostoma macrostomum CBS 122681 TaxID=1314788 RepID=A0A6A6TPB3_9PLEO|nr:hypothetical protein K491DRAFT_711373 [Lophiostoma macrostomum CBS 122681]
MDWISFQIKARRAIPNQRLPEKRYWIGVLRHDRSAAGSLGENDFVWMKAHGKVTIDTVKTQYAIRNQDVEIDLHFSSAITPTSIAKDLDHHGDHLIALQAIPKQQRRPLQPISRQLPAEVAPSQSSHLQAKGQDSTRSSQAPQTPKLQPTAAKSDNVTKPADTGNHISIPKSFSSDHSIVSGRTDTATLNAIPLEVRGAPHALRTPKCEASTPQHSYGVVRSGSEQPIPLPPSFTTAHRFSTPRRTSRSFSATSSDGPEPVRRRTSVTSNQTESALQSEPGSAQPISTESFPRTEARDLPAAKSPAMTTVEAKSEPPSFVQEADLQPSVNAFDPDLVFKRDPSPELPEEPKVKAIDRSIRELLKHHDPEVLEAGVYQALRILDSLKDSFAQHANISPEALAWVQSIDKLKQQSERKRTVVGVVGNTGAGKSSVINAMLDEERLVPTNCMRACTAVVTEMSWNPSQDANSKFRAEIEFISTVDWEKELKTLLKDFVSETGTILRETSDPNSDAGIAWAKFQAVYPRKTKEMLAESSVAELMRDRSVLNVLGTTKNINEARPNPFYKELQRYVDSKEKATGKNKDKEKKDKTAPQMEYWPLIKVVKIYTKSPALSTGAVIVDLPGVHDANAARAAVAQGYMKQCTGLWIVAPITRAVDDQAAKKLLGDSFKRQLKYDGGFSAVTFICSKTDDISITEAIGSLDLEDEVSELEDQKRGCRQKLRDLEERIEEAQDSKGVYKLAYDGADEEIEMWEKLKDKFNSGETVYAPSRNDKKRKKPQKGKKFGKRSRTDDSDDDFIASDAESSVSDSETESDSDSESIRAPREPLTASEIGAKLDELKETKKNARRQRGELEMKIQDLKPGLKVAREELARVQGEINAICIAGRNDYSKGAIQLDFAAGIKELDQENAAEENEETFNPDEDLRDYDKVAQSLPVFCVSSRAYQKLCGRLVKDGDVPGFRTLEETEIPQLQAHCKKLTEGGRIQTCRTFLLNLCQQLNTFSFWATDDGTGLQLSDEEKRRQVNYLEKRLKELEKGLDKATESCIDTMKKDMHDQIFEKYPEVIEEAIEAAPGTARGWGAHKMDGGLVWATYKATVRRDGTYTGASGFRDFNSELIGPITKRLAPGWERSFQNRLPKAIELYTRDSSRLLHRFHETVEEQARQSGVGLASLSLLKTQIYGYEQVFESLNTDLVTSMTELQREANRDFLPTVVANMHAAYEICTDERGPGSFLRMKNAMHDHVDRERHRMFKNATLTVQNHLLNAMCRALKEMMESKADEIFVMMRNDYMTVLGGVKVDQNAIVSKEERNLRAKIKALLQTVDEQFKSLVGGDVEDPVDGETEQDGADGEPSKASVIEDDDNIESQTESREGQTEATIDESTKPDSARNTPTEDLDMTGVEGPSDAASMSVASKDADSSSADAINSVISNDVDMNDDDDDEL